VSKRTQRANERTQRANEWFAAKGVKPTCSQCGSESFEPLVFEDEPQNMTLLVVTAADIRGPGGVRAYTMMCTNCGHLLLFGAKKMGLPRRSR
jgi:hypothetical protein